MSADKIRRCLTDFLRNRSHPVKTVSDKTHLFFDLGLKSEDGVYFVLDLCDALDHEFPLDFNPFTDRDEKKIVRVGEMVSRIEQVTSHQER